MEWMVEHFSEGVVAGVLRGLATRGKLEHYAKEQNEVPAFPSPFWGILEDIVGALDRYHRSVFTPSLA